MMLNAIKAQDVNVLASRANWAWPEALRDLFKPRGVNLLVAQRADEFVDILGSQRIHTTIIDMDSEMSNGLATVRIIRMDYPRLPCIMLKNKADKTLLDQALKLNVFSVIDKPVDMSVLQKQMNKLFMKVYGSDIFSD